MSPYLVAILFGIGVSGWVWSKVMRRTGNADQKSAAITAGLAGLGAFIVLFTLMKFVFNF